jgi:hypothetical protein
MMRVSTLVCLFFYILIPTLFVYPVSLAQPIQNSQAAPQRENIALGKEYVLSPPPNYQYCTDPDDDVQLTDGVYTEGYYWTQKSTVGWYLYSPQITIDLGKPEPIEGIMINCPGGGLAGVKFPVEITYLVSDDNETFYEVARLKPRGLKQDGKDWYTHRFLADGLHTRGRYVMILLDKAGSTVFADEIEIYKGEHNPDAVEFANPPQSRQDMAFAQYGLTHDSYRRGHFPEWPHVKWAIPLAGGPIKAILMAYSGDMREVVEVAQRMDLDHEPVSHFSYYRPKALGGLMQEQIERALPECEVMIVGGYRWEATPKELLEKIKNRVRDGMGLICISPIPQWLDPIRDVLDAAPLEGDQGVLDFVPVQLIPYYHRPAESHFNLGTYGKGRVASVNWSSFCRGSNSLVPNFRLEDLDDDAMGPLEYSFAALCQLLRWAAGRDVRRITAIEASEGQVRVTLSPGDQPVTLQVHVRDRFFDDEKQMSAQVSESGGSSLFTHDIGLYGANSVDVWVKDEDGRIIDFGSAAFEIEREAAIESVEIAKPFFTPGEPIGATAKVRGAAENLVLRATIKDTYGRQLDEAREVTIGQSGTADLQFHNDHPLTLCALLYLDLYQNSGKIDQRIERIWIDLPEKDDYTFCAWYAWDAQPIAYHGLRMLHDLGVDTYVSLSTLWRAENAAFANLRHGPENVERVYPRNEDGSLVRVPCLSDPEYRAKVAERIEKMAQEYRPYGVLDWSLGDESTLGRRDYCRSPTCLAAFRELLKEFYPTLETLNESWGAEFSTWDGVMPAKKEEVEGQECLGGWMDHRRYMEILFADYHAWGRELIVKHIPDARVGISGTPRLNAYSGHDWWQLMQRSLTHLSSYGGVQRELQRSFLRPGTFYSTFLGYDYRDNDEQGARYSPWDLLFHGANGINYYTLVSDTLNCPLIRPDGSLTNKAPWFFQEVQELKAGPGKLFMSATYENDGIAIHYSPSSIHAAEATGLFDHRDALRNYNTNLSNLSRILQQCHYQYDFIHADQMMAGELAKVKLLILPWSSAISDAEAQAIKGFVERGGTILADSYCGVRDDHGSPRAMLDELFGIQQPLGIPELQHGEMVLRRETLRRSPLNELLSGLTNIPVASGSRAVQLDGAESLAMIGDTPALMVHQYGEGMAIFLNASFSNYGQVWDAGVAGEVLEEIASPQSVTRPIRELVRRLLRIVDIEPSLKVTADNGLSSELEISRFALGDAQLIGVLRSITGGPIDRTDELAYELILPQKAHLYECRSGSYLGKESRITDQIPRGIARVYAALPYHVKDILLQGPTEVQQGDILRLDIQITAKGEEIGSHVVHLSVNGPNERANSQRWHYAENLKLDQGHGIAEIPFAFSDTPGEWIIQVRDVMTGITGKLTVICAPR